MNSAAVEVLHISSHPIFYIFCNLIWLALFIIALVTASGSVLQHATFSGSSKKLGCFSEGKNKVQTFENKVIKRVSKGINISLKKL